MNYGVVAHEFSHILNGDMRLNLHLAAMLKGYYLRRGRGPHPAAQQQSRPHGTQRAQQQRPDVAMLRLALWLLGLVGAATAGFIKAAMGKEYLADASAVQYTRNPDGIGDALEIIGGYIPGTLVHAARAAEMSHIFFGEIEHRLWNVFATHPPLHRKRVRRVDPDWDGELIQREVTHYQHGQPTPRQAAEVGVGRAALVAAACAAVHRPDSDPLIQVGEAGLVDAAFWPDCGRTRGPDGPPGGLVPLVFVRHAHEPLGAHALITAC